jgi:VanZ family protein
VDTSQKPGPALRWLVWLAFFIAWTVALLVPIPDAPMPVGDGPDLKWLIGKPLHVSAYAFLTILAAWLPIPGRWWLLIPLVLLVHAGATEFLQNFVERTGSVRDVLLDWLGIALGLVITWRWRRGELARGRPGS